MTDFIEEAVREFEDTFKYIGNKGVECDHISIKNMADFMASKLKEQRKRLVLGEEDLVRIIGHNKDYSLNYYTMTNGEYKKCKALADKIIAHQKEKEGKDE